MINLASTASKLQVITGSALASTVIHASYVDLTTSTGAITPGAANASISTAATSDVVAAPASGVVRNIKFLSLRNTNASPQTITIQHTDGTNVVILWYGVLTQNQYVQLDDYGVFTVFSSGGLPYAAYNQSVGLSNASVATVSAGYATDTYLAGSAINVPNGQIRSGTTYRCVFDMVKTGAGIATPIFNVRMGTAGTTADTAIATTTFAAGTAAADTGLVEVYLAFNSGGASVFARSCVNIRHALAATGLTATGAAGNATIISTVSGINTTGSGLIIGVSFNGGTSFSGTNTVVQADLKL